MLRILPLVWGLVVAVGSGCGANTSADRTGTHVTADQRAGLTSEVAVEKPAPQAAPEPRVRESRFPDDTTLMLKGFAAPIGTPCTPPKGESVPTILDEHGEPIDLAHPSAVEPLIGRRVFACVPVRLVMAGHVVSAAGGHPISNATVIVESWWTAAPIGGPQPERQLVLSARVETDASGNWHVAPDLRWMPATIEEAGFPFFVSGYCVQAPGYAPHTFDPWGTPSQAFADPPTEVALSPGAPPEQSKNSEHSLCGIPLGPPLLD